MIEINTEDFANTLLEVVLRMDKDLIKSHEAIARALKGIAKEIELIKKQNGKKQKTK